MKTSKIGIISGTLFNDETIWGKLKKRTIENKYGCSAPVYIGSELVFLPRHRAPCGGYLLPHQINHRANITALKSLGVSEVVATASTGSLKKNIPPASIVIPNDFLALYPLPTTIARTPHHPVPGFNQEMRNKLITATMTAGYDFFDGGIYWQTSGPRLETRAEIATMNDFADLVGMTIASEASLCVEMELPYAAICSVDNYANGIGNKPLIAEGIKIGANANAGKVIKILKNYLALPRGEFFRQNHQ